NPGSIHGVLSSNGGFVPRVATRSVHALTSAQREEISRGLANGDTLSAIARRIRRAPSTVSREVRRNGGAVAYRAEAAEYRAARHRKRPKTCVLATNGRLRHVVARKLAQKGS